MMTHKDCGGYCLTDGVNVDCSRCGGPLAPDQVEVIM